MKKILVLLLSLLTFGSFAQPGTFMLSAGAVVSNGAVANIGAGNDITFTNPHPNHKVWRVDSTYTGTITVPNGCTSLTWQIIDHDTHAIVTSGSTLSVTYTFQWTSGRNIYDLKVSPFRPGYTIKPRIFPGEIRVLPPVAGESSADIVNDLSGAGNGSKDGSWTDRAPAAYSSGTTYATGNNVKYSGKYYKSKVGSNINHQPDVSPTQWLQIYSYVIWYKGSGTRINPFYWRSTDLNFPVHFVFVNASVTSTAAFRMFDPGSISNVIFDGCRSDAVYGLTLTRSSNFSEGVYFTFSDASNTTRTSSNVTFAGISIENTNNTIGGSGFVFAPCCGGGTAPSVNNYDDYAMQYGTVFRIKIRNTRDEGFYMQHFDDDLHGTYAFAPAQYVWIFDNDVLNTGNESFQMGSCFNCEVFKNSFVNAGTRNQSLHRNNLQWSQGSRNTTYYMNYFDGSKNAWQAFTGRGGSDMEFFSNLLYSTGKPGLSAEGNNDGTNMLVRLEQNSYFTEMYWGVFNNTFIFNNDVPMNFYLDVGSPTTIFNKYVYADNIIVTNTATTKTLNNSFSSSMLTENNYQVTNIATPGFVDSGNKNFKLTSLSSPAFRTRTTFTKTHWLSNYDYDGFQFNTDVVGSYSGWELQTGN